MKDYLNPPMGIGLEFINNTSAYLFQRSPCLSRRLVYRRLLCRAGRELQRRAIWLYLGCYRQESCHACPPVVSPGRSSKRSPSHTFPRGISMATPWSISQISRASLRGGSGRSSGADPKAALDLNADGHVDLGTSSLSASAGWSKSTPRSPRTSQNSSTSLGAGRRGDLHCAVRSRATPGPGSSGV